jgi:hypothetical protein
VHHQPPSGVALEHVGRDRAEDRQGSREQRYRGGGQCQVPALSLHGCFLADNAEPRHDRHISRSSLSAQARYAAGTREILDCWFDDRPIREEYLIVQGGRLAGAGAGSYSTPQGLRLV